METRSTLDTATELETATALETASRCVPGSGGLTFSAPDGPPGPTRTGACVLADHAAVASLPTERLEADLMSTAANLAAGTCRFLLLVAEYDRRGAWESWECRSAAHWLSFKCGLSMNTARDQVRVARRLVDMPLVRAEFARGALSYSKVRALSRVCRPAIEGDLLTVALHSTASQLEQACSHLRRVQELNEADGATADAALEDAEKDARTRTYLTLDDDASGHGVGRFRISGEEMEVLQRALATAATDLKGRDQLATNAAALMELARAYLANPATGPGPQPEIVIHVDAAGLAALRPDQPADADDQPAVEALGEAARSVSAETSESSDAADAGSDRVTTSDLREERWPIRSAMGRLFSLALLARLACDAGLRAVADLPDGTQLDLGRHRRTPTPEQRRALLARDVHCRFPGCDTRRHLHAHHIRWWSLGGLTDLSNLLMLCPMHHHAIHDRHWTLTGTAEDPVFSRPDGRIVHPVAERVDGRYDDLMVAASRTASAHGHHDLDVEFPGGRWLGDHIDWDWFFAGLCSRNPDGHL